MYLSYNAQGRIPWPIALKRKQTVQLGSGSCRATWSGDSSAIAGKCNLKRAPGWKPEGIYTTSKNLKPSKE